MTPEEKKAQMDARNAAIVAYYSDGHKLAECASHFRISRQRTLQILKDAGAWRPYVKNNRTQFLGVTVTEETKEGLKNVADERGVSVSQFASDVLDDAVKAAR